MAAPDRPAKECDVSSGFEPSNRLDWDRLCRRRLLRSIVRGSFSAPVRLGCHNLSSRLYRPRTKAVGDLLEQISRSEDEVSKALAILFQRPVEANEQELAAARLRRERGGAPGKKNDPLGDQINCEQIVRKVQGCQRLWVIC